MPGAKHSLVSLLIMCDGNLTVEFMSKKHIVKKINCNVAVDDRSGEMFYSNLVRESNQMMTSDVTGESLSV